MKSFLNNISSIVGDFIPEEYYSIYARASSGKSLYLLEESANLIAQGATVVYLNTEAGFQGIYDNWHEKFEQKFNMKFDDVHFKLYKLYTVEELMKFLGNPISIQVGKNGKISTLLEATDEKETGDTLWIHISHSKNVVFILDSFSALFREDYNTTVTNFSARADATGFLFKTLKTLMKKTGGFTIMSHHASIDPMNLYHQPDKVRGGSVISYYSKYMLYLEIPIKGTMKDFRKVYGVRVSGRKDWAQQSWLKITDDGIFDTTNEEAEEQYNKKKGE